MFKTAALRKQPSLVKNVGILVVFSFGHYFVWVGESLG